MVARLLPTGVSESVCLSSMDWFNTVSGQALYTIRCSPQWREIEVAGVHTYPAHFTSSSRSFSRNFCNGHRLPSRQIWRDGAGCSNPRGLAETPTPFRCPLPVAFVLDSVGAMIHRDEQFSISHCRSFLRRLYQHQSDHLKYYGTHSCGYEPNHTNQ